jgi:hypothetical protein
MNTPKRLVRIAGILYLLVAIFEGFCRRICGAQDLGCRPTFPAAAAGNVVANAGWCAWVSCHLVLTGIECWELQDPEHPRAVPSSADHSFDHSLGTRQAIA